MMDSSVDPEEYSSNPGPSQGSFHRDGQMFSHSNVELQSESLPQGGMIGKTASQQTLASTKQDSLRFYNINASSENPGGSPMDSSEDDDDDDDDDDDVLTGRNRCANRASRLRKQFIRKSGVTGTPQRKGMRPDENNNFVRLLYIDKPPKYWADENVFNRTEFLAQPRPLPEGYTGNINSAKKPPPVGPDGLTVFDMTPRLLDLCKPIKVCGVWCGKKHCHWEHEYPAQTHGTSGECDIERLKELAKATPRCAPCMYDYKVKPSALTFEITRRLERLAIPKKHVDMNQYYDDLFHKKLDIAPKLRKQQRLCIDKCDMENTRVLIRCDLDYANTKKVSLAKKIQEVVHTIKYALEHGAQSVVIASHCGEPQGLVNPKFSLKVIKDDLEKALQTPVTFIDDCVGYEALTLCDDPSPGSVFLLENLRFHAQEDGCGVDEKGQEYVCLPEAVHAFRNKFFSLGDVYVVDTLTGLMDLSNTSMGDHKQERAIGLRIKRELEAYNKAVVKAKQPSVAVIGGTFKSLITITYNIIGTVSDILLGGQLALVFVKTLKDQDVGLMEEITPSMEKKVLKVLNRAKDNNCNIHLPSDHVLRDTREGQALRVANAKSDIDNWFEIVDIGPETRESYSGVIYSAATVVWMGKMGVLPEGSAAVAAAIDKYTKEKGLQSYLADPDVMAAFNTACPQGKASHMPENPEMIHKFLRGKTPKALKDLTSFRKSVKKRPARVQEESTKPVKYELPGLRVETAGNKLCLHHMDLTDKRVLVRANLDLSMLNDAPDLYNLRLLVPTVNYILASGARLVILLGYMRPKENHGNLPPTLKPVAEELEKLLDKQVHFVSESLMDKEALEAAMEEIPEGSVVMMENLLNYPEEYSTLLNDATTRVCHVAPPTVERSQDTEVTPESVVQYCEALSSLGDVYVLESLDGLHMDVCSTTGSMHRDTACGFLLKNELKYLAKTLNNPPRRFLAIVGGSRLADKIGLLRSLFTEVDDVILTGTVGLHFQHVDQGMFLSKSLDPSIDLDEISSLLEIAKKNNVRLFYPVDFVITDEVKNKSAAEETSASKGIRQGFLAVDIGDRSQKLFTQIIKRSKLILWLGVPGVSTLYKDGATAIYNAVVYQTRNAEIPAVSIAAGRSVSDFIHEQDPNHEGISFLTSAGDAAIQLLIEKSLVGLERIPAANKVCKLRKNCMSSTSADIKDRRVLLLTDIRDTEDPAVLKPLANTIKGFLKKGATSVVIVSHMGSPGGQFCEQLSLQGLRPGLEKVLREEVKFLENGVHDAAINACQHPQPGAVFLLENLGFHPEESGVEYTPKGSPVRVSHEQLKKYRSILSGLGDVFINDSLQDIVAKRSSVVGITSGTRCLGPNLKTELTKIAPFLTEGQSHVALIVGGEISEDLGMRLYNLIDRVNDIFLCGDAALTFLNERNPLPIEANQSLAALVRRIQSKAKFNNVTIHLPVDFVVCDSEEGEPQTVGVEDITEELKVFDIGHETVHQFTDALGPANTIIMTGPAGSYKNEKFAEGTKGLLSAISELTKAGSQSLALGPVMHQCLTTLELVDCVTAMSDSTGAFLDMLCGKCLPGLEIMSSKTEGTLKKLTLTQVDLTDKRVMIRLDLGIPTVGGVVLDTDLLEEGVPTIKYCLEHGAKCVVIVGQRGNPEGTYNANLSTEPLITELSILLQTPVWFMSQPASHKSRVILEDPTPGTVFLMENLAFYPAEMGEDAESSVDGEVVNEGEAPLEEEAVGGESPSTEDVEKPAEPASEEQQPEEEAVASGIMSPNQQDENRDEAYDPGSPGSISASQGGKVHHKTVKEFVADMRSCADVFVNDDVAHIGDALTSNTGFGIHERACGLLLLHHIETQTADMSDVVGLPAIAALSRAK